MAVKPLHFHILLFIAILTYSFLKTSGESFKEYDVYLKLRLEGQWELKEGIATAIVLIEDSEIDEIKGRKAIFTLREPKELPSSDRFETLGRVDVKKGSIFITSPPWEMEELPPHKSIRKELKEKLSASVEEEYQRAIAQAFLFGEMRRNLPLEVEGVFLKTGLIHVLVVSGLHIGLVFLILSSLLPGVYGKILGLFGILLYSFLFVPPNPPVLRAVIMFSIYVLSFLSFRRHCPLCSLFFSGNLLLLLFPHFSFSLSFWLSFFAVLYILLTLQREGSFFKNSLMVSIAAFTGTAPIISSISFISPLSLLLSPLLAPLVTAYALFGIMSLVTLFNIPLTLLFMELAGKLLYAILSSFSDFSPNLFPDIDIREAFLLSSFGAVALYLSKSMAQKFVVLGFINFYLLFKSI